MRAGRIKVERREERPLPEKGKVKRYILSSAQNNTRLHAQVWTNLLALAKHYGAEIMVSRYLYDTRFHGKTAKPGTADHQGHDGVWYDERIEPYVCDRSVQLALGLVFCGEVQILPTAKRPLSGFESYTGRASCILPHAKFAMASVASGKHEAAKLIYTTGTVTLRNYVKKKAGHLATFHHGYGAVLVEVDDQGSWWVRQLNADSGGTIYDLDVRARSGRVTAGHRVEAVSWGDAHARRADRVVRDLAWAPGGMLERLRPKHQFFHDLLDFRSRNHHEIDSGRKRFERAVSGAGAEDDVAQELREAAAELVYRSRPWCKTVVVASNHDQALLRWLDTADYRVDPKNALTFLTLQHAVYRAIVRGDKAFDVFEYGVRRYGAKLPKNVRFLREDESYIVCRDANGGIECGMHGHLGPNGTKGSANAFARMGRKAIVGHTHSAGIVDGVYTAGTSSDLDLGYNRGPSSWTHSHVVVYPNGKRTIVTMWKGKWRA